MNNTDRIPEDVLTNGFKDGDDWDAATLNKIVAVLIAGINANYAALNNTEFVPNPNLQIFIEQTYNPDKTEITEQLDGKITSYFTDNDPNTWDATERTKHDGDMWYLPTYKTLKTYRASTNSWISIEDSTALAAYENASKAQDTADGKRRIFTTTPTTPYDVGDLWTQGSTGDILKCKTQRLTGDYNANDWEIASKYPIEIGNINDTLSDISSDNKLTPDEKIQIKKEWDVIVSERPLLEAQADRYFVSHANYDDVYEVLEMYIEPLLSDLTTTSTVIGTEFREKFQSYYDEKTKLINAIRNEPLILEDGLSVSTISYNNLVNDHSFELTRADADGKVINPELYSYGSGKYLWNIRSGSPKLVAMEFLSDFQFAKFDMKCAEVSNNDKLTQALRLKKNTTYTFSGYYRNNLHSIVNPKIFIEYKLSNGLIIEELTEEVILDTEPSEEWKRVKYTFTTPPGNINYSLISHIVLASSATDFIYWDGIQVIEAPTPCVYNAESQFFKYANEAIALKNDIRITPRDGWVPCLPRDGVFEVTDVSSLPLCTISLPLSSENVFIFDMMMVGDKIKFSKADEIGNQKYGVIKEINNDGFSFLLTVKLESWVSLTPGELGAFYSSKVETPTGFPVELSSSRNIATAVVPGRPVINAAVAYQSYKISPLFAMNIVGGDTLTVSGDRINIGAGVHKVLVSGNLNIVGSPISGSIPEVSFLIVKNGDFSSVIAYGTKIADERLYIRAISPYLIDVQEGDYLEMMLSASQTGNYTILGDSKSSFITVEVIN